MSTAAIEFLELVLPEKEWSVLVAIDPKGGSPAALGVSRENLEEVGPWLERNATRNVYWSPNSLTDRLDKKPTKNDIAWMNFVHLDLDDPRMTAREQLLGYRVRPTLILFSGGGYQAFWKLRQPVSVNGNIPELEAANRRVIEDLGGDKGTFNIDRIMRLPGTTNWPTKTKLKRNPDRVPVAAELIECDLSRVYTLTDFPAVAPEAAKPVDDVVGDGKKVDQSRLLLSAITKDYAAGVTDRATIHAKYADHPHVVTQATDAAKARAIDRCIELAAKRKAQRDEWLEEMNRKHAVVWLGNKLTIMWLEQWNGSLPRLASVGDMKIQYENRFFNFQDWLKDGSRAEYPGGIVFEPGGLTTAGAFNLWRGFAVTPKKGDCSKLLAMVKDLICSGDEALYRYVLEWCADLIQKPAERPGIALVLRGNPGTGKGTFAHALGSLLGEHYVYVSRSEHVVGKFNAHLATGLLLFADEAVFAGTHSTEGVLKSLITERELPIEPKFRDVIRVHNHVRLIMASNQDWVVSAGLDDRRFAIIDVSPGRKNDTTYFGAIKTELEAGGRAALLDYLMTYPLGAVDLRVIPKTDARLDQQVRSLDAEEKWWLDMLQTEDHEAPPYGKSGWKFGGVAEPATLHASYLRHCDDMRQQHRLSLTQFGIRIQRVFLPKLVVKCEATAEERRELNLSDRVRVYRLPTLAEARRQFEALVGRPIPWPTGGVSGPEAAET